MLKQDDLGSWKKNLPTIDEVESTCWSLKV